MSPAHADASDQSTAGVDYIRVSDGLGSHVKRLREVRRLTQDELAERSGLAADTIRRLEHEEFSPSLRTLRKVCKGLGISVSAMFNALELAEPGTGLARISTLLIGRSAAELSMVERVLASLLDGVDDYKKPDS